MAIENGFANAVWANARTQGLSAPKIADAMMREYWPATSEAAKAEEADSMFRRGVIVAVKEVLRTSPEDIGQLDFGAIDPQFAPLVEPLKRTTYYVPSLEALVPVAALIREPELLNEARKFMRQKGMECLGEARHLDRLYEARMASIDSPSLLPPEPQDQQASHERR